MGVSTNFLVVWGRKIPWHQQLADLYEENYDDNQAPWVLVDGMSGEYVVMGVKLWDSGDARWGFEDMDPARVIDLAILPAWEKAYKEHFEKYYPTLSHLMYPDFQMHVFAHFS
jgi:hypothetical protein